MLFSGFESIASAVAVLYYFEKTKDSDIANRCADVLSMKNVIALI